MVIKKILKIKKCIIKQRFKKKELDNSTEGQNDLNEVIPAIELSQISVRKKEGESNEEVKNNFDNKSCLTVIIVDINAKRRAYCRSI